MAGPTAGTSLTRCVFHSTAEFFIARQRGENAPTPSEEVSTSSKESPAQSSTLQEQASSPLTKQFPRLPPEIWLQIGKALSTINDIRNFVRSSATHFHLGCEVMVKKFRPSSFEDAVELFKLPHSKLANLAFDKKNRNYASQHNRLFRELFSQDGLKSTPRGNCLRIFKLLLSTSRSITVQDLIDIELLDPLVLPELALHDIHPDTRLSPEHTAYFFNNLIELLTQKPAPNMVPFLKIPSNQIKEGIVMAPNEEVRDLMFESRMFLHSYNEIGEPLHLKHPFETGYPFYASYPAYSRHPLHWAADNNRWDRVEEMLEDGVSIDVLSWKVGSALHGMVKKDNLEGSTILLKKGASTEVRDKEGYTPFLTLVKSEATSRLTIESFLGICNSLAINSQATLPSNILLKQRVSTNGDYALEIAAQIDSLDKVKSLITLNQSIDPADTDGFQQQSKNRALRYAVKKSNFEMVEVLLKENAQLDQRWSLENGVSWTLLHVAISRASVEMLEFVADNLEKLFEKEADSLLRLAAFRGDLPIWEFVSKKSEKLFIVKEHADEATVRETRRALLKTALSRFNFDIAEDLLKQDKTLVNLTTTEDTYTPLHRVIATEANKGEEEERQLQSVRVLLNYGAKVDILHGRNSPLMLAVIKNRINIVQLLADIEQENIYTPEHFMAALETAVECELPDIFSILVESRHFDKSFNKANKDLMMKICPPEGSEYLYVSDLYSREMANSLADQLTGGKKAVLAWAEESGHDAIVDMLIDLETESDITEFDPSLSDGSGSD